MKVVHFQRNPGAKGFSLENIFRTVRAFLPEYINCSVKVSKYESRGIFKRLYNIFEAFLRQQQVNHITGDVHFLCYLMSRNKTILTILDCVYEFNTKGIKRFIIWLFWYYIPLHRVSYITVISESTKSKLVELCNVKPYKISVIPCCISPLYTYIPKIFNVDSPQILQIGTGQNKNLFRLFEAIKGINCVLDIVGRLTNEHLDALKQYNIQYINSWNISEDEIIQKYVECDLVTFVSIYEGFGMPIVEANATGRPVITSNLLSMPEVAGDAACIVDPYSVDSIRSGISQIISEKCYREQLIEKGLNNAKRFSAEVIAQLYADLYCEVYAANK